MPKAATIKGVINKAKQYLPALDERRVLRAYEFAKKAHEGQRRSSGEPYVQHPLEVAKILVALRPDEDSIIAALLHDVLEDTDITLEKITAEFGDAIIPLLRGLEKLGKVYYRGEERQIENLRKMFLAMAKDIRVILIKLSDRLHNMRTLQHIPEHKQKRISQETLMIYSPIAARLGIYNIKNELDDLCFEYLYSKDYERLMREMGELTGVQAGIIQASKRILLKALKNARIAAEIEGRIKHLYSIFKKLKRKEKNYPSELYDILALRITVETEAECYQVLGLIHKHWTPLPRRFKDYIGNPKPNGYQSLHTTIVGLCPELYNQPIEIQIRTREMDAIARLGVAAHWQYKEEKGHSIAVPEHKLDWIKNLVDLHESLQSNQEFVESLTVDVFRDRIFVLTPGGNVFDLPLGATPVDFAYAIHTDVGHRCKGAKVNGRIVPLNYSLKNGQVVEILTKNMSEPNSYWLSFVATSHAKQRIKQWINAQNKDKIIKIGKEMLNAQLKRFDQPALSSNLTLLRDLDGKKLSIRERELILEKIGNGSIDVVSVAKKLIPLRHRQTAYRQEQLNRTVLTEAVQLENTDDILITGERGYKTQIASCCQPKTGVVIVGYVTRGRGVSIHAGTCKMLKGLDSQRFVGAKWGTKKSNEFVTKIRLKRRSRIGLLRDVADVFASNQLAILDIENRRQEGSDLGEMIITSSFDTPGTLTFIMGQLKEIADVFHVEEVK